MNEIPRMTGEEIAALGKRVALGEVFIGNSAAVCECAFPLVLSVLAGEEKLPEPETIGALWEENAKAGPRSINGYPFFTSVNFVHSDDVPAVREAIERAQAAVAAI